MKITNKGITVVCKNESKIWIFKYKNGNPAFKIWIDEENYCYAYHDLPSNEQFIPVSKFGSHHTIKDVVRHVMDSQPN